MRNFDIRVQQWLEATAGVQAVVDLLTPLGNVYLVGGAIRDIGLARRVSDLDFVIEGDAIKAADQLDGMVDHVVTHERFRTARLSLGQISFDLASSRVEAYDRPGALPRVTIGASIEEDLLRRDFTVNALAWHLADRRMVSAPSSIDDLARRKLVVMHERSFYDDPTRILRLLRYGARLDFVADVATDRSAREAIAANALATISGARAGTELRLLLQEPQPAALLQMADSGVGGQLLGPGFRVDSGRLGRLESCVPALAAIDLVRLAACCIEIGSSELRDSLNHLGFSAAESNLICRAACRGPLLAERLDQVSSRLDIWDLATGEDAETITLAAALARDIGREHARVWFEELSSMKLAIDGGDLKDLGLTGAQIGRGLLAAQRSLVVDPALTREQQLEAAQAIIGDG